jgi:hypothetical protein
VRKWKDNIKVVLKNYDCCGLESGGSGEWPDQTRVMSLRAPSIAGNFSTGGIWRVLTVVYDSHNHWISGLCPSPWILNTRKHDVPNTYLEFQTLAEVQKPSDYDFLTGWIFGDWEECAPSSWIRVHSASNRNEYQKQIMFLGSRARPVLKVDNLTAICVPIVYTL